MSRRTGASRITRRILDCLAVLVIAFTVVSIEQLPAWLPFVLILTAGALAYLGRRLTIVDRRSDRTPFALPITKDHR